MENIAQLRTPVSGGRISTPKFREASRQAEDFKGLPEGVTKFDILRLVKHAGREIGFTDRMIQVLEYYLLFTKDQDWKAGARPIMYQAQAKTALHFSVSERQIQKIEGALFNVGALTWNDSGNYRRFGVRDEDNGDILYAFGVDLSPLASLYPVLQKKLHEKELRDATWMEQKRRISWYRARIRALLAEGALQGLSAAELNDATAAYDTISVPIRTHMALEALLTIRRQHESLYEQVLDKLDQATAAAPACGLSQESSSMDDQKGVYSQTTKQTPSDKSDTVAQRAAGFRGSVVRPVVPESQKRAIGKAVEPPLPEASEKLSNITPKQILNSCSQRFKDQLHLCYGNRPRPMTFNDVIDAAYVVRSTLGISKSAWVDACELLGPGAAAICVMVIDQKAQDPENRVLNPGGYLRGMVKKAREGKLNLHGAIFGLLKRGEGELNA